MLPLMNGPILPSSNVLSTFFGANAKGIETQGDLTLLWTSCTRQSVLEPFKEVDKQRDKQTDTFMLTRHAKALR